jgi:hypothetical protein
MYIVLMYLYCSHTCICIHETQCSPGGDTQTVTNTSPPARIHTVCFFTCVAYQMRCLLVALAQIRKGERGEDGQREEKTDRERDSSR